MGAEIINLPDNKTKLGRRAGQFDHLELNQRVKVPCKTAVQIAAEPAAEEGVVLLEARPGLAERTILWHPEGWQPAKE